MIKGVILDMDGLMIDNEPLHSLSVAKVIKMYGKRPIIKPNGLIHTVGLKGDEQWIEIKTTHGITEDIEVLREKRRRVYIEIIKKRGVKVMPGLKKLLRTLKDKNIRLGLASNTSKDHILIVLNRISALHYFDVIISADQVKKAKPNPDIYLKATKELKLKAAECLVLEDSETGVLAAKKAGTLVIAVPSAFTKHQDFSQADSIIPSLETVSWQLISSFS